MDFQFGHQIQGLAAGRVVEGDALPVAGEKGHPLGGQLVQEVTVDENDPNQRPTLDAVALSGAQLVFFPLSQPSTGSRILQTARQIPALSSVVFISAEGMLSDVFIHDAGPAGVGVYILGPATPSGAGNAQFREAYRVKYGELPPAFYFSFAADATNLLLDTVQKVAVQDPDGTLHVGRQALRDALYAVTNYSGLTGHLKCDAFGDCGVTAFNVVRLDDPAVTVEALRANVVYTYSSEPTPEP